MLLKTCLFAVVFVFALVVLEQGVLTTYHSHLRPQQLHEPTDANGARGKLSIVRSGPSTHQRVEQWAKRLLGRGAPAPSPRPPPPRPPPPAPQPPAAAPTARSAAAAEVRPAGLVREESKASTLLKLGAGWLAGAASSASAAVALPARASSPRASDPGIELVSRTSLLSMSAVSGVQQHEPQASEEQHSLEEEYDTQRLRGSPERIRTSGCEAYFKGLISYRSSKMLPGEHPVEFFVCPRRRPHDPLPQLSVSKLVFGDSLYEAGCRPHSFRNVLKMTSRARPQSVLEWRVTIVLSHLDSSLERFDSTSPHFVHVVNAWWSSCPSPPESWIYISPPKTNTERHTMSKADAGKRCWWAEGNNCMQSERSEEPLLFLELELVRISLAGVLRQLPERRMTNKQEIVRQLPNLITATLFQLFFTISVAEEAVGLELVDFGPNDILYNKVGPHLPANAQRGSVELWEYHVVNHTFWLEPKRAHFTHVRLIDFDASKHIFDDVRSDVTAAAALERLEQARRVVPARNVAHVVTALSTFVPQLDALSSTRTGQLWRASLDDLLTQMRSGKAGSLRQLLRTHSFFSSLSQRPPPGRAYSVTRRYGYTDPRRLQALVKQAVVANPDAFRAPA